MPDISQLFMMKLALSFLIVSQLIANTKGQTSNGLLGGASSITASSVFNDAQCQAADAKYSNTADCWCTNYDQNCNNGNVYLEVNLNGMKKSHQRWCQAMPMG
eukprot:82041_1